MKLSKLNDGGYSLQLSEAEIGLLWATLRESFATLSEKDFRLRIGCEVATAHRIASELHSLLEQVDFPE